MKTNKILTISLLAATTLFTTGCKDSFLEVENPTGEPLEDYYTTDEHIQEGLQPRRHAELAHAVQLRG